MSEKTVNLTLDNLKELFTHWADEMRKPVPPTPQEQAELAQAQQYRLENANSVKEKMERTPAASSAESPSKLLPSM